MSEERNIRLERLDVDTQQYVECIVQRFAQLRLLDYSGVVIRIEPLLVLFSS